MEYLLVTLFPLFPLFPLFRLLELKVLAFELWRIWSTPQGITAESPYTRNGLVLGVFILRKSTCVFIRYDAIRRNVMR